MAAFDTTFVAAYVAAVEGPFESAFTAA